MAEHRGRKGTGYVTDTAILCSRDMTGILLGRRTRSTVGMTFITVINPTGVVKDTVGKTAARKTMAHSAILGSIRVARCNGCLASCADCNIIRTAIMARSAIARDTRVIKDRWSESNICMTNVAILTCGQVTCGFYSRQRCGKEFAGMAAFTTRCKARVNITQKD